uniref:Transposase n=1 Tax=viral metagenome TaxID=1070528 RepID=A0A6M3K2A2_9ZZZZ
MTIKEGLLIEHIRRLEDDNEQLLKLCEAQTLALRESTRLIEEARGWARKMAHGRRIPSGD